MTRHSLSRRITRVLALGAAASALVLVGATPASAAPLTPAPGVQPNHGNGNGNGGGPGGGGGGGGATGGSGGGSSSSGSTTTGFDVSYPQCGTTLPTPAAFAIVGVNDGLANTLNPCLGPSATYPSYTESELYWATSTAVGGTSAPKVALYVNTADPGNVYNNAPITDWPTSGTTPDGTCTTTSVKLHGHSYTVGANSDACAWQYGYNKATQDGTWLTSAADAINGQQSSVSVPDRVGSYTWWLDVETANTWQADTTMNVADLQGMIVGFAAAAATSTASVGAYSTAAQWDSITGGTTTAAAGSLLGIPNWIPGATSLSSAQSNCTLPSFTGGTVSITQWASTLDNDYAC